MKRIINLKIQDQQEYDKSSFQFAISKNVNIT